MIIQPCVLLDTQLHVKEPDGGNQTCSPGGLNILQTTMNPHKTPDCSPSMPGPHDCSILSPEDE